MDILNSPVAVIVIFGLIAGIILIRKFSGADTRCGECKTGRLEEVKAKPEGLLGDTTANSAGKTAVRYQVTYRCTSCGSSLVRAESRS